MRKKNSPWSSGIGVKRAEGVYGSIRVRMAVNREELRAVDLDDRLSWARLWRRRVFYLEYLNSDAWRSIRAQVIHRDRGRCRCGADGSDVHHLTYQNLGNEKLEDLILLCRECHQTEHGREFDQ
jgi:5-methylcytosine-specific restriction endonuclease McrA